MVKGSRRKPRAPHASGRGTKKRRRWPDEIGISDSAASGHHREGPCDQGKPEHAGVPGGPEGNEDGDQGSSADDFQGESALGSYSYLSGQRAPARKVCRLPSGLEKGVRSFEVRRKDAGVRAELVNVVGFRSLVVNHHLVAEFEIANDQRRTTNDRKLEQNMAIKTYRPTTQTLRYRTTIVNDDLTTAKPYKPLLSPKQKTGGRRNSGDTTMRFIGGGHKRKLRIIDFKRDKTGIPATVTTIEYDPNRSPRIALLAYADGEKRYIIQPEGLKVGQKVVSGPEADILVGNALPLRNIPPGTQIHNLELKPGKGGQMVRSAGGAAQLVAKEEEYALVKLPSGETRKISQDCMATIGQVGNIDHENVTIGKAK